MPHGFRRIVPLFVVAVLLFCVGACFGESHARIVRLSYVSGEVEMDRGTGNGYETALLNMPVLSQSHIRTGTDGEAELVFENGSTVRLTPETEITLSDLGLADNGEHVTHISMARGLAYIAWKHQDGSDFQFEVNAHIVQVKNSAHLRVSGNDDQTAVAVLSGGAKVSTDSGSVEVKSGEALTLDANQDGRYFLARTIDPDPYDEWDKERDNARDESAQRRVAAAASYYGSDLDYYGNWTNSSLGQLWQPYGVDAGWSPYADGSWAWYPGWGWQWVSAYPWGFVPYHYGTWVFVPGRGYCWRRPTHFRPGRWNNITYITNNNFSGVHGTGIIPPNGTHDTGIVPTPPRFAATESGQTLVSVGRGPHVDWDNSELRMAHRGHENSFRSTGTGTSVPANVPGNVEVHSTIPNRIMPVHTEATHTQGTRTESAVPRRPVVVTPSPAPAPAVHMAPPVSASHASPAAVHSAPAGVPAMRGSAEFHAEHAGGMSTGTGAHAAAGGTGAHAGPR